MNQTNEPNVSSDCARCGHLARNHHGCGLNDPCLVDGCKCEFFCFQPRERSAPSPEAASESTLDLEAIEGATPRPWASSGTIVYAKAAPLLNGIREQPAVAQCGSTDERSASFIDDRYSEQPEIVRTANAALIVKAVNERDALLAEIKRLREQLKK